MGLWDNNGSLRLKCGKLVNLSNQQLYVVIWRCSSLVGRCYSVWHWIPFHILDYEIQGFSFQRPWICCYVETEYLYICC